MSETSRGEETLAGDALVVDEGSGLVSEQVCRIPDPEGRAAGWRKPKAFEVHAALKELRAASHLVDVCLARLLRLMNLSGPGFRRWGCVNFDQYITQELRQPSSRRFRYLVAIDEAIVTRPLVKLGDAWRRERVSVSQAREVIRVMTPDNEQEWLERAGSMGVKELQAVVQRELSSIGRSGAAQIARDEARGDQAWDRRAFAATRPVDDAWQVCVETSPRMADGLSPGGTAGPPDPDDLHRRIRWILRVGRNISWHECRLLLRLVAGLALFESLGSTSMESYATRLLGYSVRSIRSVLAVARTLERFPKIAGAFWAGWITGAEALLIGKVARPGTQGDWITRAASSTLQALKLDVAFRLQTEDVCGLPPARPLPHAGNGVRPCAWPPAGRSWAGQPESDPEDDCMRVRTCAPRTSQNNPTPPSSRVDGWFAAFCTDQSTVGRAMLSPDGTHRPVMFHAPVDLCRWWDLTLARCRGRAPEGSRLTDSQCVASILLNFLHEMIHSGCIKVRGRALHGLEWVMGVNAAGYVRERYRNGLRVACDPFWTTLKTATSSSAAPRTVAPDDWRQACDAVA